MKSITESLLLESEVPVVDEIKEAITSSKEYQRLIEISKKYFTKGLTNQEKDEAEDLFKDRKVVKILDAATKYGRKMGWIKGGVYGSFIGLFGGSFAALASSGGFAVVLLGALLGGLTIGFITSRIYGILQRWDAENEISSGRGYRMHD